MERKYSASLLICFLLFLFSSTPVLGAGIAPFSLPQIPDTLRNVESRAAFLVEHYWDNADFDRLATTEYSDTLEQAFVDFINIFPYADNATLQNGTANLVSGSLTSPDAFRDISALAEKYLYTPESPMASDQYYSLFLTAVVENPAIDSSLKIRPKLQLEAIAKNRPGTQAADFRFTDRDGSERTLYELDTDCDILLVFYDPDCDHCAETTAELTASRPYLDAVAAAKLKVVAVYSGEELDVWQNTASDLPADWTVGYDDGTLQDEGLYVLRTMPTLFLLSGSKNVILKEPTLETLLNAIKINS